MSTRNNQANQRRGIGSSGKKQSPTTGRLAGKRYHAGSCGFRLSRRIELSPGGFLKRLCGRLAKALLPVRRSSPQVSSSGRSGPFVAPPDTHRTEAIEDCIEFINTSSSFPRECRRPKLSSKSLFNT